VLNLTVGGRGRRSLRFAGLEKCGANQGNKQGRRVDEDIRIIAGSGRRDRVIRNQLPNRRSKIGPPCRRFEGDAIDHVLSVNSGEMNEHIAIVSATENEPGITFIRNTAIALQPNACLYQRALYPIELGSLLLGPIARRRWRSLED